MRIVCTFEVKFAHSWPNSYMALEQLSRMQTLAHRILQPFWLYLRALISVSTRNLLQALKRRPKLSILLCICFVWWLVCLPKPLFKVPYASSVENTQGQLLSARIASDGQWRMYPSDTLPEKYITCLIHFEDRWFRWHPGVNIVSMAKALAINIGHGDIKRGGSTITMQTIRLARNNPKRTFFEKLKEVGMATRLELTYSKAEILKMYAGHAPFGGNIVGIDVAAWRYFGVHPIDLSWAQCATLAVLPNSPGLMHPGRNRDALQQKRNRLLAELLKIGKINNETYELAVSESLPEAPAPIPNLTPHLLNRLTLAAQKRHDPIMRFTTPIDAQLQTNLRNTLSYFGQLYAGNGVHNLSAVVQRVEDGAVLAYVGNVPSAPKEHGTDVDILSAVRSTGSILKPFLFAMALQDGQILPQSLLPDVPMHLSGYKPENYKLTYDGAVPANRALIRSLNVPFVLALSKYDVGKFQNNLGRLGISSIQKSAEHYGLSLILGGAEVNLLELSNAYVGMARTSTYYTTSSSRYANVSFFPARLQVNDAMPKIEQRADAPFLSAGAIFSTFEQMRQLERPDDSGEWELFQTTRQIAWKTGTSYGFRDAWAVGVTPEYVIGVWVGNADGEGRPGLIGAHTAAPVLFRILDNLPHTTWFDTPFDDLRQIAVCRRSGNRVNSNCAEIDSVWLPRSCLSGPPCQHCVLLHLDEATRTQVRAECAPTGGKITHQSWFCLPPDQEAWFKLHNPWYQTPPPLHPNCTVYSEHGLPTQEISITYPANNARIILPKNLSGVRNQVVLQASHRRQEARIHWHLDTEFLGTTLQFHEWAIEIPRGKHTVTLVDEKGERAVRTFEVL